MGFGVEGWLFILAVLFATWFFFLRLTINLGLSSVAVGSLLVFHGPMYWLYTRYWIYGDSIFFKLYLSAGRSVSGNVSGENSVPALSAGPPIYDNLHRLARDPNFSASIERLDLSMSFLFVGVILGIVIVDRLLRLSSKDFRSGLDLWELTTLRTSLSVPVGRVVFSGLLVSCSILLLYAFYSTGKFSLVYQYFVSNAGEFEKIKLRREGGGFPYLYGLYLSTAALFMSMYAIAESRSRHHYLWLLSLFFIFIVLFGKLAYLSKAPAVVYLLQISVAIVMINALRLSRRVAVVLVLTMLFGMVLMVFTANSNLTDLQGALSFLFYRLFMIPNEGLVEYFLVFPNYFPHTLGMDNKFISYIFGMEKIDESYWRVAEVLRGVRGSTTTAMFIADAWAQFSWLGVAVFPVFFGALLRWIDYYLIIKIGKSSVSIAGLSLGHYGIFVAISTSLLTAFLTGGLLLLPMVILFGGFRSVWPSKIR